MLFGEKESAVELYNALEGTDYGDDVEFEFTTLNDAVYGDFKNDLGFKIAGKYVVLTEHQSTINKNMAVRHLQYLGRIMIRIITMEEIAEVRAEERAPEIAEERAKDLAKEQVKELYGKYIICCKHNGDSAEEIHSLKTIYGLDGETAEEYIQQFYGNA